MLIYSTIKKDINMEQIKKFTFRLPYSTWKFYKKMATENDMKMTELMLNILNKHKNNSEKILTGRDTMVS
jgi:predicted DNA-binding ribbon-helix-helix protein